MREKQRKLRNEIDKLRKDNLLDIEYQNASAQKALFDMYILHAEYIDKFRVTHELPRIVRRALHAMA